MTISERTPLLFCLIAPGMAHIEQLSGDVKGKFDRLKKLGSD